MFRHADFDLIPIIKHAYVAAIALRTPPLTQSSS